MTKKNIGYIDGRRIRVGGVPTWGPVPDVLIPGSMEAYGIFEEFIGIEQLNIGGNSHDWEYWIQNAAVFSQGDEAGGVALITCGGANNDSGQIILGGLASGGAFRLAAGKHLWFEARFKHTLVTSPAEIGLFAGLINPVNAAILGDGLVALPNDDMLGWVVRDSEINWSFVGDNASVEDLNPLGATYALDTDYHYFGFYVNGVTNVVVYYDRAVVAAGAITTAEIPDTVSLMPAIAIKAGAAAAEILTIDYLMCVQLR